MRIEPAATAHDNGGCTEAGRRRSRQQRKIQTLNSATYWRWAGDEFIISAFTLFYSPIPKLFEELEHDAQYIQLPEIS